MMDIRWFVRLLITWLLTYKLLILTGLFIRVAAGSEGLAAQAPDPVQSIRDLRKGCLIVRLPADKSKIDTLEAMTRRSTDPDKKARLAKQLLEAKEERDTLWSDYTAAFKNQYDFSKVAYFADHEARDLNTASYYDLEGNLISLGDLSEMPLFYLYFDRTEESRMDALILYDRNGIRIPPPFPNDFTQGGINFLFIKISDKNFPAWRVGKMNKRLFRFWEESGGTVQ